MRLAGRHAAASPPTRRDHCRRPLPGAPGSIGNGKSWALDRSVPFDKATRPVIGNTPDRTPPRAPSRRARPGRLYLARAEPGSHSATPVWADRQLSPGGPDVRRSWPPARAPVPRSPARRRPCSTSPSGDLARKFLLLRPNRSGLGPRFDDAGRRGFVRERRLAQAAAKRPVSGVAGCSTPRSYSAQISSGRTASRAARARSGRRSRAGWRRRAAACAWRGCCPRRRPPAAGR